MSKDVESGEFDPVVRLFSALANPIRARIVNRLTDGEASVGELSEIVGVKQPLVSHHLKVLRSAHLVSARKDGQKAILKITDDDSERIGCELMVWWNGNGAAKVLA
ncbi:MAG: metalloregulator ArsR/SmtB family transcription factor, partial [Cutibacterium avidum]|nr:metalloregulator ArsR/SmtB family transcription factor [Cutibacterium avidum]